MNKMRILAVVAALAVSAVFHVPSASASDSFEDLDKWVYEVGEVITIKECWKASRPTRLSFRKDGEIQVIARSQVKRNSKACKNARKPHLHTYKWRITPESIKDGSVFLIINASPTISFGTSIRIDGVTETPSPETPAPAPAPVPPAWSPTDSTTWSAQEINFVRYLRAALESRTRADALWSCRGLANPAEDGANRMFYDLAADQGVRLHGIDRSRARQLAPHFYNNICSALFGLSARIV